MINRVILGGQVVTVKRANKAIFVLLSNKYKFMDKYTKEVKVRQSLHWIRFDSLNSKQIKTSDFIVVEGKLTYIHDIKIKEIKTGLILALNFHFVKNIPIPKIIISEDYEEVL